MMPAWILLTIPATPLLLWALLSLSATVEDRVLSPQSLVAAAARSRASDPDYAELFVARQLAPLVSAARD
jgi:hypothetical protein